MIKKIIKKILYKNKILNVPETPVDERDWLFSEDMLVGNQSVSNKEFSRKNLTPSVKNQGKIGSCVGHSGRVVYGDTPEFKAKEPSAMWIYKKGKENDPFPGEDYSGTTIKGACRGLVIEGCCEEEYWPYRDNENTQMLEGAQQNASKYKIESYHVVLKSNHNLIKKALLQESLWTSINVHEALYYTPSNGIVDSEKYLKSKPIGGHAIAMTGWKIIDGDLYWEFQNSWGKWFGKRGFFYLESSLYEKILINALGPIYLKTKSDSLPVDPNKKIEPKKNKSIFRIIGMAVTSILAWLSKKIFK